MNREKEIFVCAIFVSTMLGIGYLVTKGLKYIYKRSKKEPHINVKSDMLEMMKNTPLIYIKSLSEITGCKIYGKCEYLLPYTSKDRMIKNILLDAQR